MKKKALFYMSVCENSLQRVFRLNKAIVKMDIEV